MATLYELLGVNNKATLAEIRKGYLKYALKAHPDKKAGDASEFIAIQEAYETLSDASKKAEYDNTLYTPSPAEASSGSDTTLNLEQLQAHIDRFIREDEIFACVYRGAAIRSQIQAVLIPFITKHFVDKNTTSVGEQLSKILSQIHTALYEAIRVHSKLDRLNSNSATQSLQLSSNAQDPKIKIAERLKLISSEIQELKNWELPIRLMLLSFDLQNTDYLNNLWICKKEAAKAILNERHVSIEKLDLLLLAISHPEALQLINPDNWKDILQTYISFRTEPGADNAKRNNSKAKEKFALLLHRRIHGQYAQEMGRYLHKGIIDPLIWIEYRKTILNLFGQATTNVLLNIIYNSYVKAACESPGNGLPFDVPYLPNVCDQTFHVMYGDSCEDEYLCNVTINRMIDKLIEISNRRHQYSSIETKAHKSMVANLFQLCSERFSNSDKIYYTVSTLKGYLDALITHHRNSSKLKILSSLTSPPLVRDYNKILKDITKIYSEAKNIKPIGGVVLSNGSSQIDLLAQGPQLH